MKVIQLTTSSVMLLAVVAALSSGGCRHGQTKPQPPAKGDSPRIEHFVAASQTDKFCGWPANNGLWTWDRGKEILVGFSFGNYVEQSGHNIQGKSDRAEGVLSRLARSGDGGRTWRMEDPDNYVGDWNEVSPSPGGIVFDDAGFAMRVVGVGYHGAHDSTLSSISLTLMFKSFRSFDRSSSCRVSSSSNCTAFLS